MLDKKTKELIAIGASVSCNCHPCVKFHLDKARKLGIEPGDIKEALKSRDDSSSQCCRPDGRASFRSFRRAWY